MKFLLLLLPFYLSPGFGQISLVNGGFEDQAADATIPKGWLPCEKNTTPDILPGFWGEYGEASQGDTYVGLIVREDSSYESIGQRLSHTLKKGECYQFKLDLSKGALYSGYNNAIKLRIWIGSEKCGRDQMIYLSPLISHHNWKSYLIEFTPKQDFQYIRIEAHYQDGQFTYKGNIMIDNISTIKLCSRV